jgi:hypothetical protein
MKPSVANTYKILFWFIAVWTGLNILQAALVNVDADEAYYWMYSRHLSWGYFDHPPLVALSIKLGESFGHGSLFTRLGTILFSAGTVFFGYKMLPDAWRNIRTYLLIFSSIVLFHTYGFITTPDASLLFFTVAFFAAYKSFLQQSSVANALWLAISITGLLYSKYHGILPVAFTFLSNPRVALKPTAWLVVLLVCLGFAPHLYWQYGAGWPTFQYHLSERIASRYRLSKTTNYILGQLFIWGPLTTIPALVWFTRKKFKGDIYLKAHLFTFVGVMVFFLLSSLRSTIEPHWTLVAGPSFVVLFHSVYNGLSHKTAKTVRTLLIINIALILAIRIAFMIPGLPLDKISGFQTLIYSRAWAHSLHKKLADQPVVFNDSYRLPALYQYYYPQAHTIGYNTIYYRKTQYNISEDIRLFNNRNVIVAAQGQLSEGADSLDTKFTKLYLHSLPAFKTVQNLRVKVLNEVKGLQGGKALSVSVLVSNVGEDTIRTDGLSIGYTFLKTRNDQTVSDTSFKIVDAVLTPGYKKQQSIQLTAPTAPGTYNLIFTIVQPPFAGSFASRFYKVEVR